MPEYSLCLRKDFFPSIAFPRDCQRYPYCGDWGDGVDDDHLQASPWSAHSRVPSTPPCHTQSCNTGRSRPISPALSPSWWLVMSHNLWPFPPGIGRRQPDLLRGGELPGSRWSRVLVSCREGEGCQPSDPQTLQAFIFTRLLDFLETFRGLIFIVWILSTFWDFHQIYSTLLNDPIMDTRCSCRRFVFSKQLLIFLSTWKKSPFSHLVSIVWIGVARQRSPKMKTKPAILAPPIDDWSQWWSCCFFSLSHSDVKISHLYFPSIYISYD